MVETLRLLKEPRQQMHQQQHSPKKRSAAGTLCGKFELKDTRFSLPFEQSLEEALPREQWPRPSVVRSEKPTFHLLSVETPRAWSDVQWRQKASAFQCQLLHSGQVVQHATAHPVICRDASSLLRDYLTDSLRLWTDPLGPKHS